MVLVNLPIFERFVISDSGDTLYIRTLDDAKEFNIVYTHSANKTPVQDYYKIEEGRFILYKTVFYSYGAGMSDTGAKISDGTVLIDNLDTEFKEFSVFVGTIANHTVFFEDESLPLSRLAPPKTLLQFKIKGVSFVEQISFEGW